MDFGTIKVKNNFFFLIFLNFLQTKLNTNVYQDCQEFLDDMELVFKNCITYNTEDSDIGKTS